MTGTSITVVGAGGNIGSHLAPHLARMPGVARLTLVDRDQYEARNLASQNITPADVGKPKAMVQAARARRIMPGLRVDAMVGSVEHLPLGRLRADVILACLDSRRARQHVNQIAWRLGVAWIDAGVRAEEMLARVKVYLPGEETPCLECAWSDEDYETLDQTYPCLGARAAEPAATNAPSALGALAASLQALECQKLLAGKVDLAAAGTQVTVDTMWHKHLVTAYRRNPHCRFDHRTWGIEKLDCRIGRLKVAEAIELMGELGLEGKPFVTKLRCTRCGRVKRLLRLACCLRPAERQCAGCGSDMAAAGFDLVDRFVAPLPARVGSRTLASIGLRPGDVLNAGDTGYELTDQAA